MKTLLTLILAASAYAGPVVVGSISTNLTCSGETCWLQPQITNATNVTFGSGNLMTLVQASYVLGGETLQDVYFLPFGGSGVAANSSLSVPIFIPVAATSWSVSVTTSLRPPLMRTDRFGVTYYGITSFLTDQWYVAQNTYVSGTATNGSADLSVLDAVEGWMHPSGLGGILPGPLNTQFSALANVPEPSAYGFMLFGAAALWVARKRR